MVQRMLFRVGTHFKIQNPLEYVGGFVREVLAVPHYKYALLTIPTYKNYEKSSGTGLVNVFIIEDFL